MHQGKEGASRFRQGDAGGTLKGGGIFHVYIFLSAVHHARKVRVALCLLRHVNNCLSVNEVL